MRGNSALWAVVNLNKMRIEAYIASNISSETYIANRFRSTEIITAVTFLYIWHNASFQIPTEINSGVNYGSWAPVYALHALNHITRFFLRVRKFSVLGTWQNP